MRVELTRGVALDLRSPQVRADGFRCWIGGESGSGKSTVAASIVEQVVNAGGQVIVLDAHGEYGNIWTLAPARVVRIGYGDDPVTQASMEWCLDVIAGGNSLLLDLSHWTDLYPRELDRFVLGLMRGIYELRRKDPKFTLVLVEEAQVFIPQQQMSGQAENIKIFIGMVTGGRKYGLQFIFTTQRQSLVDVSALASCNVRIFMRTTEFKDWKRIRSYIPAKLKVSYDGDKRRGLRFLPNGTGVLLTRWTADCLAALRRPSVDLRQYT